MKKNNIIYWTTTGLIFLFEGVMPALTGHSEMAKAGIRNLGYPDYFVTMLVVFKVLGALTLVIPQVPYRLKEWAYAGFTFALLSASVSNWAVFGLGFEAIMPLIILGVLAVSYLQFHKIHPMQRIVS
ncbi:MAG: DoxX family protein [Lewinellaceae bacterium]|nr:DoxX family protein [Lewinellaceae bacterium]